MAACTYLGAINTVVVNRPVEMDRRGGAKALGRGVYAMLVSLSALSVTGQGSAGHREGFSCFPECVKIERSPWRTGSGCRTLQVVKWERDVSEGTGRCQEDIVFCIVLRICCLQKVICIVLRKKR